MSTKKELRIACAGFNQQEAYIDTLRNHLPALERLFTGLDAGTTPNFLDMMSALSEIVAFYTDCDTPADEIDVLIQSMSQNKCRFCS